jgi:hypothetical protein
MPLSGSARTTKSVLINKKGFSEDQAMAYLIANGFITPTRDTPTTKRKKAWSALESLSSTVAAPPPVKNPPPIIAQTPDLTDDEIDPSFKKLIDYKHYAHKHGVDVPENVVLSFLDKTDQLTKQDQEVISYDDLYQGVEKHLAALAVKYTPKEESILTAPLP